MLLYFYDFYGILVYDMIYYMIYDMIYNNNLFSLFDFLFSSAFLA